MNEQRNLILALVISFVILFGYDYFFRSTPLTPPQQTQEATVAPQAITAAPVLSRQEALDQSKQRIQIQSDTLRGSLNLKGAKFDDLSLVQYRETTDQKSPQIILLSPTNSEHAYYSAFSWKDQTQNKVLTPNEDTIWTPKSSSPLTPATPITLQWNNGQGLIFEQVIALDKNYMFKITQKVTNTSAHAVLLSPQGQIVRYGKPQTSGYFILHEGPVGVFDGKLHDPSYDDMEKNPIHNPQEIGWLGITDKYWLTALVPDQKQKITSSFYTHKQNETPVFITEYKRDILTIAPGSFVEVSDHFFAGAKILTMLDAYEEQLGIRHFDLAVDFGWFYFLTKPIFYALAFLKQILGNFGLAILVLTILFKGLFFPLANKSYLSMAKMKAAQPEINRIKEVYQHDRMKMNEKMMALYKKESINPVSGCLPMLIQIPVFFALYKVLFVTIEMRHAPFYGWIQDLSAPDPTSVFTLFGLIPWDLPSFLTIGILPIFMGVTMLLQQRMSPPPADPVQAKMFMIMPIFFTGLLAQFPAGLVIYWTWNNLLSIAQQWVITRQAEQAKALKKIKR